ncbi:MAG: hypothetical protein R2685_16185 [Candidatus Nitrosocosmicus sp.]|nr:hypothetical protein [Candidatus Nitrosocosmicus sp.]
MGIGKIDGKIAKNRRMIVNGIGRKKIPKGILSILNNKVFFRRGFEKPVN